MKHEDAKKKPGRPRTRDIKAADLIGFYGSAILLRRGDKEIRKRAAALMNALLGRKATSEEVDLVDLARDFD